MQTMKSKKQPWEVFTTGINFSKNMEDDEVVDASLSEVKVYNFLTEEDVTASMITGDIFASDDNTLACVIQGGEDGTQYKVSFRAHISDTKKLEEDLLISLRD